MSIYSMTAFANARTELEHKVVQLEIRSVNNRYLDLHIRLPDELKFFEPTMRDYIAGSIRRGKLDIRLQLQTMATTQALALPKDMLNQIGQQLKEIRRYIPQIQAPSFSELLDLSHQHSHIQAEKWFPALNQLLQEALTELIANRKREGARLAESMRAITQKMHTHLKQIEAQLPQVLYDYQQKLAQRLKETLEQASPQGMQYISAEEFSARLAQEVSLFSVRIDVAEELTRLKAHTKELDYLLNKKNIDDNNQNKKRQGSLGKRLDFLFQEMNREVNTLGSKAGSIELSQAAIELKLLVDQLREQAQNIE